MHESVKDVLLKHVASMSTEDRVELAKLLVEGTGHEVLSQSVVQAYVPHEEVAWQTKVTYAEMQKADPVFKKHVDVWMYDKPYVPQPTSEEDSVEAVEKVWDLANKLCKFLNAKYTKFHFYASAGGSKFKRIVRESKTDFGLPDPASATAYCFVDAAGFIYKAAGWGTPAKDARGTVAGVLNEIIPVDLHGHWLYK